jgi:hypothetical protein
LGGEVIGFLTRSCIDVVRVAPAVQAVEGSDPDRRRVLAIVRIHIYVTILPKAFIRVIALTGKIIRKRKLNQGTGAPSFRLIYTF